MQLGDAISFGSLFVFVLTGIIIPFAQRPMLGYESMEKSQVNSNVTQYVLKVKNLGLVKLTNVVGSLSLPFKSLSTFPFLTSDLFNFNYTKSSTFFKISVLPPQATISIILLSNHSNSPSLPVANYIASEEWTGYPAWKIIVINILVAITGVTLAYYFINILRRY